MTALTLFAGDINTDVTIFRFHLAYKILQVSCVCAWNVILFTS